MKTNLNEQNQVVTDFLKNKTLNNKIEVCERFGFGTAKISINGYQQLNQIKTSISTICEVALKSITDTDSSTKEIETVNYAVMDLLRLSIALDLNSESEFLDKIQSLPKKNADEEIKIQKLFWSTDENAVDPETYKKPKVNTLEKYLELSNNSM